MNFGDDQQDLEQLALGRQGSDQLLGRQSVPQNRSGEQATDKLPDVSAQNAKFLDISKFNHSLQQIDNENNKPDP